MGTIMLRCMLPVLVCLCLLGMTATDVSAKTFDIRKGSKSLVAFWKCEVGFGMCWTKFCVEIANKSDGQPGRARFFSDWSLGKYRDHGVHTGKYCDNLWGFIFTGYWLYASPEDEDLSVTTSNNVAP